MSHEKLSGMAAYVAAGISALATACAPTLPPTTMEVSFYKSPLDGSNIYVTEDQAHSPEMGEMLAKRAIAANDQFFVTHPDDSRKEYWNTVKGLIKDNGVKFICTITAGCPTEGTKGRVVCGLDGYTGVLDAEYLQTNALDGQIETAELIPDFNVPYTGTATCNNYAFDKEGGIRVIIGSKKMQRNLDNLVSNGGK